MYKNFTRVAEKRFRNPEQIAGTEHHYFVITGDGTLYKDGEILVPKAFEGKTVVDLDASGEHYYVLTLKDGVYRNDSLVIPPDAIPRPRAMCVLDDVIFILGEKGKLYKFMKFITELSDNGLYPDHFTVDNINIFYSIPAGPSGTARIYKSRNKLYGGETYAVKELGIFHEDFYLFDGKILFKNGAIDSQIEYANGSDGTKDFPKDFHFMNVR